MCIHDANNFLGITSLEFLSTNLRGSSVKVKSFRLRQTCISLCTRPSVSGVQSGAWHRPRSLYTSHARLYFNRGSSETLCVVSRPKGLSPGWAITSVTKSATAESGRAPSRLGTFARNVRLRCCASCFRSNFAMIRGRSSMEIPKDAFRATLFNASRAWKVRGGISGNGKRPCEAHSR